MTDSTTPNPDSVPPVPPADDPILPWPVASPTEPHRYAPPPPPLGPPPVSPWPAPPPRHPKVLGKLVAVAAVALLAGTVGGIALTDSSHSSGISIGGSDSGSGAASNDRSSGQGSGINDFGSSGSSSSTTSSDVNVRKIADSVSPAIVNIASTLSNGTQTAGSGVVISSSGLVLTNNHVINGASRVDVEIGVTGETHQAEVLGYDAGDDVALIQLDHASGMQTVKTADSSSVSRNDAVIAIGNALGRFGEPSVVTGTVTALHQGITAGDGAEQETLSDMIRIAAAIQPGDSGGALLNLDGEVIGINTAADTGSGFSRFGSQAGTTGFAIPIERALAIAHQIRTGNESNGVHIGGRALLGVVLADSNDGFSQYSGAEITDVGSDSPADHAGLQGGDTITAVDGHSVSSGDELRSVLESYHPGDKVKVTWIDSSGVRHSATVTLSDGPPA
jgi:S1-C subfamily serine protease